MVHYIGLWRCYMAYKPKKLKNKPTEDEIEKAAYEMAAFLYDMYQKKKLKETENGTPIPN